MAALLAVILLVPSTAYAQGAPATEPASQNAPVFRQEELDQILAPIALYPDDLLAQVLMASTYPLELVQAERWAKDPNHAKLKGDELAAALQNETWDPSVKSLVPFPQVLEMMSDKLDWTQKLGDAVLAQRKDVMESVQRLRQQAQATGNLKTTEQQTVAVQDQAIMIQPADPQVVYVPTYNPSVVYGTWPYPAYPPVYYPPPPYYYPPGTALAAGIGFAAGVAIVGSLWGWGNCNWGHGDINVNRTNYNNINRGNINAGRATQLPAGGGAGWQHEASHRGGVAYRDPATRQAYQRPSPGGAGGASARQNFRGYDVAARPAQGAGRPSQGPGASRPTQGAARPAPGAPSGTQGRVGAGSTARPATQPAFQRQQASAFSGVGSGADVRAQANRGQASRQQMSAGRSAAPRAAPRGGGGGRRR